MIGCLLLLLINSRVSISNNKTISEDNEFKKYTEKICYEYLTNYRQSLGYSLEEQQKITLIAYLLEIDEEWLYDMFYLECRHNHQAINSFTGATGLIQFMPNTASKLGTNVLELYHMSKYEQLDYVHLYLDKVKNRYGKFNTKTELYLAIFYPMAIGQLSDYQIGGEKVYRWNSGIDKKGNNNGQIEISDIESWINYNIS